MSSHAPTNGRDGRTRLPRWVIVFSAAVMLSTCVPYAYHAARAPRDRVFTWVLENLYDQNSYFMWAEQVRDGRLLAHNLMTTEHQPPLLPSLPWLALGLLGRVIPVPLACLYHLLRLAAGFFYLLLVYRLAQRFLKTERECVYATVIVGIGAGAGGFVAALNRLCPEPVLRSADWMPELWAYHSLLLFPHFALSLLLIAVIVCLLLDAYERPRWPRVCALVVSFALVTYTHPYAAVVLGPVLVIHFLTCRLARPEGWAGTWTNLVALLGVLPPAALLAWQFGTHPGARAWARTILLSPPPLGYLLGFGIVLPLAVGGWILLARKDRPSAGRWLLMIWPLVGLLLLYSYPTIPFERRLVEGLHLPLAMLAAVAISRWGVPALTRRWPRLSVRGASVLWIALLVALMLPSDLVLLANTMRAKAPTIPKDWMTASRWIRQHTDEDVCVMTGPYVGSYLARYAQRRVYLGHWAMTVDFEAKFARWRRLCGPATTVPQRQRILAHSGCELVVADPDQREVLAQWPALQEVLFTPELSVYRLTPVGAAVRD